MASHAVHMLKTLPPPVTFHSTETLHRILLPPLAEFLSDLTAAEHLLKLHDILDRYRTPKSYHRIDVREVDSSELPWATQADVKEGKADGVSSAGPDGTHLGPRVGAEGGVKKDAHSNGNVEVEQTNFGKLDLSADKQDGVQGGIAHSLGAVASATPAATTLVDMTDEARWQLRARGRPIILPTEQDVQDYLANRDRPPPKAEVMDVTAVKLSGSKEVKVEGSGSGAGGIGASDVKTKEKDLGQDQKTDDLGSAGEAMDDRSKVVRTSAPTATQIEQPQGISTGTRMTTRLDEDLLVPALRAPGQPAPSLPVSSSLAHTPADPPVNPSSEANARIPPPPPSPPKRRVRELRLDLRTLDAAALFQLEIWRREVMGLDKLEMEHPDSIWFHEPTPEPSPSPEPVSGPVPQKGKGPRGRPKKALQGSMRVEVEEPGANSAVAHDEKPDLKLGEPTVGGQETVADAMREAQQGVKSDEKDISQEAKMDEEATIHAEGQACASKEESRSPSPDHIVLDAFDEKEDDDPDFVPPATPPPVRRGRPRRSAAHADVEPAGAPATGDMTRGSVLPPSIGRARRGRSSTQASRQSASVVPDANAEQSKPDLRQRASTSMSTQSAEKRRISLEGAVTLINIKPGYIANLAQARPAKRPRMSVAVELPPPRASRGSAKPTSSGVDIGDSSSASRSTRGHARGSTKPVMATPTPASKAATSGGRTSRQPRRIAPKSHMPTSATSTRSRRNEVIEIVDSAEDELDSMDDDEDDESQEGGSGMGRKDGQDGNGGVMSEEEEEWGFLRGF